ncbi:uncharacterized protein LAJ45_10318 [Morchella importuna]|uniref:uncharacterized protein n=1 Tax=Morchella importuna TaxID=1174673 RepID=UPI001E8D4EEA|nr:uncharacterized protein LAJ45_10318 [Morchella importuna]KAH8145678.1 hypothetical protein LAJ45_10318 [Morchella importuna]
MTLSSEIVVLLNHLTNSMNNVTSPGQHAVLSTDERKAAMEHLKASVEVLASLAEAVRIDAASRGGAVAETTEKGEEGAAAETTKKKEEEEEVAARKTTAGIVFHYP